MLAKKTCGYAQELDSWKYYLNRHVLIKAVIKNRIMLIKKQMASTMNLSATQFIKALWQNH